MKENIETKDVQRTEYLDKNGLDMLWAKVKENTRNQVEVEYNRAKAKEDSLSQEIASVKPAEGKEFLQVEEIYNTKTLKDGPLAFGNIGNQAGVTKYAVAQQEGFLVYSAKDEPFDFKTVNISSTGIQSEDERKSDTKVWNTNGGITDLASYALNSDVTEKIAAKADKTALTSLQTTVNEKQNKPASGYSYITAKYDNSNFSYTVRCNYLAVTDDNTTAALSPVGVSILGSNLGSMYINYNGIQLSSGGSDTNAFSTNGGVIDTTVFALKSQLDNYVLKSELPTAATKEKLGVVKVGDGLNVTDGVISVDTIALPKVPTKVSELQNDSNFAYKEAVDTQIVNLQQTIAELNIHKQDKITPGNLNISALNSQNTIVALKNTIMDLIDALETSGVITVTRS